MGHSQAQKAQTHERVVQIAARRIREDGLVGLSIADVMTEAGLTQGGFYKHFASREALLVEALEAALDGGPADTRGKNLATVVRAYLSRRHRDEPGAGCALGALASEAGRSQVALRAAVTQQVEHKIDQVQRLLGGEGARADALLVLSALVGGIGLARAVSDKALSDEILRCVGDRLLDRGGANDTSQGLATGEGQRR